MDRARSDQKDLTNKLIQLRNEMSLGLLDKNMIDFIRKMRKEWSNIQNQSNQYGERIQEMSNRQDGMLRHMNTTLKKIKSTSEEPSSAERTMEDRQL